MSLEHIADRVIDTDVLIIGGGMAGCCAATMASDSGLKVTMVEKSKTERSGSASMGLDGLGGMLANPLASVRGWDMYNSNTNGPGRFSNPNVRYKLTEKSPWGFEELQKLDVTLKWDDGEYLYAPPGSAQPKTNMRLHMLNVKPELTRAVRKRKVNVLDRTMVVDLLTNNGAVVGATAVDTRVGEFIVIKAMATIISTGEFTRCYDGETPMLWKYKFMYHRCPASVSGDGQAAAYRAGAEVVNLDLTGFLFRIRDDRNLSFGNLPGGQGSPCRTFTWRGDNIPMPTASQYFELEKKGLTPLYYSLEHLPDDFQKRTEVCIADEMPVSFIIAAQRGFNPKTHRYELMANRAYTFPGGTGINVDEDCGATLEGLYAAGDCASGIGGGWGAIISGFISASNASSFISGAKEPVVDEAQVENQKQVALAPLSVKDGTPPMELECAIRHICDRYVGHIRAEGKLGEGLRRLGSLRRVFLPQLMAKNPHYLVRCLEVRNIMDLAEAHIRACMERKETRGSFFRPDYPEMDPARTNMLTYQRMENGKPVTEVKAVPDLKPEYAKEEK